jgi:hypothetical protein
MELRKDSQEIIYKGKTIVIAGDAPWRYFIMLYSKKGDFVTYDEMVTIHSFVGMSFGYAVSA